MNENFDPMLDKEPKIWSAYEKTLPELEKFIDESAANRDSEFKGDFERVKKMFADNASEEEIREAVEELKNRVAKKSNESVDKMVEGLF